MSAERVTTGIVADENSIGSTKSLLVIDQSRLPSEAINQSIPRAAFRVRTVAAVCRWARRTSARPHAYCLRLTGDWWDGEETDVHLGCRRKTRKRMEVLDDLIGQDVPGSTCRDSLF